MNLPATMNPKIECQCGAVQIMASRPKPIGIYCCHCLDCQKHPLHPLAHRPSSQPTECGPPRRCSVPTRHLETSDRQGKYPRVLFL
ncbi:hypothetical protein DER45DRAFT_571477 [Fusarium avenaceum]|nr:hypothetical protein DER45DRAFT_571477 [Fusarium avenaceum]